MNPTRIAIIGIGHLGTIHAKLWRDFAQTSPHLIQLSALYDIDHERACACADEFNRTNILGYEVRSASGLEDIWHYADAVVIASPTSTHFSLAAAALEAGKHCFIEKPITATAEEAEKLVWTAEQRQQVLHIGHVERFNPVFSAIQRSTLHPLFIESHRLAQFKPRATDVSVILDLMIHDIDLALWLVQSPVVDIRANGVAVVTDTPDIANARLQFENGCVANLTASRISAKQMRKMRLFGHNSYISLDFAEHQAEIFRITDGATAPPEHAGVPAHMLGNIEAATQNGTQERTIWYEKPALPERNALAEEQRAFIHAIHHIGQPSPPPHASAAEGREAWLALEVAEHISKQILRAMPQSLP